MIFLRFIFVCIQQKCDETDLGCVCVNWEDYP